MPRQEIPKCATIVSIMATDSEIYIKKLGEADGYTTWLVDGMCVRRDIDENFTEYDHHGHFSFIPVHEFWIDREVPEKEYDLIQKRLLYEMNLIKEGSSHEEAARKADIEETEDRRHGVCVRKMIEAQNQNVLRGKIRKKKFLEWSTDSVAVWLVDGTLVRETYMLDYAEGGHDIVYPWIPQGEVWVEESLDEKERLFILLHELHERELMKGGMSYADAHHGATIVEAHFRKHETGLAERIKEELAKN